MPADGSFRSATSRATSFTPSTLLELLLPSPFESNDAARLWRSVFLDYGGILASWLIVACARSTILELSANRHLPSLSASFVLHILPTAVLFGVVTTLVGYSEGLYRSQEEGRSRTAILAKSIALSSILLGAISLLADPEDRSLGCLVSGSLLSFALIAAGRLRREKQQPGTAAQQRNVLVVGSGSAIHDVVSHIDRNPALRRTVRSIFDEERLAALSMPALADKLATIARTEFADEIVLVAPARRDLAQVIIREAKKHHLDVTVIPDLYGCDVQESRIERLGTTPLVTLHHEALPAGGLFLKRVLDIIGSGSALVVTTPLLLVISVLIKLDSPGPILYSAERVGRKGKRFRCHKFRTMVANAGDLKERLRDKNQREGPTFKIATDPRITRLGRWLRKYSLDELPQLWNVFKGEMSLVGPRPHPLDDYARYELGHLRRLDVTPGITGLWQITARRSPSFNTNLALDLQYIEEWNFVMDLRILCKTIAVVLQGTGA